MKKRSCSRSIVSGGTTVTRPRVTGRFLALLLTLTASLAFSQNPAQSFSPGSYIIDMGQPVQTVANGLKPYGLVYQLIVVLDIPVSWAVNSSKLKDGVDFVAGGKSYSGGPFIIAADRAVPEVVNVINAWKAKGVVVDGPVQSAFTAPVYKELTSWPRAVLDQQNDKLVVPFYTNAEVPITSYVLAGNPTMLSNCGDIYVLPHADPQEWTDSSGYAAALQNFIKHDGYLWSACHAVSAIENMPGCNFLSNGGLVLWDKHSDGTPPYTYSPASAGHPIMQFLETLDASTQNGSEQIFLPLAAGWRSGTTVAVYDLDHLQVPGLSPGPAAIVAYGRAFDTAGIVMLEAGHDLNKGTVTSLVAAQRAFFNFVLMAGALKQISILNVTFPKGLVPGQTYTLSAVISGGIGPYTFKWTSGCGGVFSNATANPTTFTAPATVTNCLLKLKVTDACGRVNFASTVLNIDTTHIDTTHHDTTHLTRIDSAITRDRDGNGLIDRIDITFDTAVTVTSLMTNGFTIRYNGVTFPVDSIVKLSDSSYSLYVKEQVTGDPQTSWRPTVTLAAIPKTVPGNAVVAADGCAPVIWRVVKHVSGPDHTRDTVYVYMSEKILQQGNLPFTTGNQPGRIYYVWNSDGTVKVDSMLAGINSFSGIQKDSIFIFCMTNGKDLTDGNLFNLKADSVSMQDRFGNVTPVRNRLVRVTIEGSIATVVLFNNPSVPALTHVQNGILQFRHEVNARQWVRTEHTGVLISLNNLTRPDPSVQEKVKGSMKIYDVVGNTVNWGTNQDIFESIGGGSGMDIYWNGYNHEGMKVSPGVYRAVIFIDYPGASKIRDLKIVDKIGIRW